MTETVRINGIDVPIDSIDIPSNLNLRDAYRRLRVNRQLSMPSATQGSGSKFVGTPRLQKHRGGRFNGVRIK